MLSSKNKFRPRSKRGCSPLCATLKGMGKQFKQLIFLSLLTALVAKADEPQKIQIQQFDPVTDTTKLKTKETQVIKTWELDHQQPTKRLQRTYSLIKKSGLDSQTASWDHFSKDVLYYRARGLRKPAFVKMYPNLQNKSLGKFYDLVRAEKVVS